MTSNISLNMASLYNPYLLSLKNNSQDSTAGSGTQNQMLDSLLGQDGNSIIFDQLNAMAVQNGYTGQLTSTNNNSKPANTEKVAQMLQAGNKQEVKDEMGAQAVPALMAIVKDTSQPMQVRIDAVATLAKLVDEGKAPASCLVSLLKDPNSKDMAERAMANVGKEIMPVVKQMLNGSDPELKQSAINILNDMKDAWAGYENDPKWGQECRELLPEVDQLLQKVNNNSNSSNTSTGSTNSSGNTNSYNETYSGDLSLDDPDHPKNFAGFTRQFANYSKF